jgi:hypothetical protein
MALLALGQLSESLGSQQRETIATQYYSRFDLMDDSREALELANWAKRFHRRARTAEDCRPLRQTADERRKRLTLAEGYSPTCAEFHRG